MVFFAYNGGTTAPFLVSSGLAQFHSVKFSNILSTLDELDSSSFVYYGRVGALSISTVNSNSRIQVQAKTVNGNYGKTFPGLNPVEGNTANIDRDMMLLDLIKNATYRTFVGVFNTSSSVPVDVTFMIFNADSVRVGSSIYKYLPPHGYISFNPFTEAGAPSGDYDNCWLLIHAHTPPSSVEGVMFFGSIANNYTSDTYALIARMRY